jgi:hypothetical protein
MFPMSEGGECEHTLLKWLDKKSGQENMYVVNGRV